MKHRGRSVAGRLRAGGRNGVRVLLQGRDRQQSPASLDLGRKGAEVVLWDGGRSRGVVLPEGRMPAAVTSGPEGRRWRWPSRRRPQRGCSSAHDNTFAGGAVRIELGSHRLSLPDRSASERPLRCGVAVDGGCAAGWRWTVDRWRCSGVEPAGGAP